MNILHIIASMDPRGGGPAQGIRQMSQFDFLLNINREVVCLDSVDSLWECASGLQIHCLGKGITKYGYQAKLIPWLKSNLVRFDAVIVNGLWQYHGFAAWSVLHNSNTPYFVYTHGMLDPWFKRNYPLKHLKKWLYWPWADYRLLRDATAVLFTSEEEMLSAPESFWLYKVNARVVKYGAARPPADSNKLRDFFLHKYPELRRKRIFLFLSRIHAKKGCDILLEAFARVATTDSDVVLVLAGPDQTGLIPSLKRLAVNLNISDRVFWPGMLQGDLKWGAFYASELFVLPSHQENFGIAVAEALGCSLPVLISNKVNIWREIAADHAGLVADDTVGATETSLRRWLSFDAGARRDYASRARQVFENRYTVDQMASSLLFTINEFM